MRSKFVGVVVLVFVLALVSPAFAHYRLMHGEIAGWVGGPVGLSANGKGLVLGGPTGDLLMTPAHVKGLISACEAQKGNPSVVQIIGPGGPGCPHGE